MGEIGRDRVADIDGHEGALREVHDRNAVILDIVLGVDLGVITRQLGDVVVEDPAKQVNPVHAQVVHRAAAGLRLFQDPA